MRKWYAGPELGGGRAGRQTTATLASGQHGYSTPDTQPVALAVRKPGRGSGGDGWPVVATITHFYGDGEPILKTCWRAQHGTSKTISLPESVLSYAEAAAVRQFYLRHDRRRLMWTCPIATFRSGRLQTDGERYIPLAWLKPLPWRDWSFAVEVLRLGEPDIGADRQLGMFQGVGA